MAMPEQPIELALLTTKLGDLAHCKGMDVRQLLMGSGHSTKTALEAKNLFDDLALFIPDFTKSAAAFKGAVGKVELGDGGQKAVGLALVKLVRWLKTADQVDAVKGILHKTMKAGVMYDRTTVIRCYAESVSSTGSTDSASAKETVAQKLSRTSSKWWDIVQKWADDAAADNAAADTGAADAAAGPTAAREGFMLNLMKVNEARGMDEDVKAVLPTFVVPKEWEGSDDCRVKLCTDNTCKAGCDHRDLGCESAPRDGRTPGCGHGDKGLCLKCEPFQTGGTLRCCKVCECLFRAPNKPGRLLLKHVTVADSAGPTGYVKQCYLMKATQWGKTKNGSEIYGLREEAFEGPAKMGTLEIQMLKKAAPDKELSADTRYQVNETTELGSSGGGHCSSCLRKELFKETAATAHDDEGDVHYIPSRDDLVGCVAALAVAGGEEKRTLTSTFHDEIKRAANVDDYIKDVLKNLVRDCTTQKKNKNALSPRGFLKRLNELERTVVAVQLEVKAVLRHQSTGSGQPDHTPEVNLGITVPLQKNTGDSIVRLQAATGSGVAALLKVRGHKHAVDREPFARSLAMVANAINKGQPGPEMFVFGRRPGTIALRTSLHHFSLARKAATNESGSKDAAKRYMDEIASIFPGVAVGSDLNQNHLTLKATTRDQTQNKSIRTHNDKAKKFFVRGVEQVTTISGEGETCFSCEQQAAGDSGVAAAVFNAFANPDAISMPYSGPGNHSAGRWSDELDDAAQKDVLKALLGLGKVTAASVENTASVVFSTALRGWLQTALDGLATMHSLVSCSVKQEGLDYSSSASAPVPAMPTPANSDAGSTIKPKGGVEACPDTIPATMNSAVPAPAPSNSNGDKTSVSGEQEDLDNDVKSVNDNSDCDDAGIANQADSGDGAQVHENVGSSSSAAPAALQQRDTISPGPVSEQISNAGQPAISRRSSGRLSVEPATEKNELSNVKIACTVTDWNKQDNPNAVIATKDFEKGELVFREVLGAGFDDAEKHDYEGKFENFYPWATLSKGSYFIKLIDEDTIRPSTVYMVNHADRKGNSHSGPNCKVTAESPKDDVCLVKFTALRKIATGDELTYDYQCGETQSSVQIPLFPKELSRQCKRAANECPAYFSHPNSNIRTKMCVNTVNKNGDCFFTSVARQLDLDTFYLGSDDKEFFDIDETVKAVRPEAGKWKHSEVRHLLRNFMMDPDRKSQLSDIKEQYEATKDDTAKWCPELQSRMATRSTPRTSVLTFDEMAESIINDGKWASPPIITIVQTMLKADLWWKKVEIGDDGKQVISKWCCQTHDYTLAPESPRETTRAMYMVLTVHKDKENTEHYDSLEPEVDSAAAQSSGDSNTNRKKRQANDPLTDMQKSERLARQLVAEDNRAIKEKAAAEELNRSFAADLQQKIDDENEKVAKEKAATETGAKRGGKTQAQGPKSKRRKQTNDKTDDN